MSKNKSLVGIRGTDVIIGFQKRILSKEEAINLAAWIVALTDIDEFEKEYQDVVNS